MRETVPRQELTGSRANPAGGAGRGALLHCVRLRIEQARGLQGIHGSVRHGLDGSRGLRDHGSLHLSLA